MASFGSYDYSADQSRTALAYRLTEKGGVDTCNCIYCRNFQAARPQVFPADFLALLHQLGIDPTKDGEVYHNGRIDLGRHDYAGWFHFIGALNETGDSPTVNFGAGFTAWMCHTSASTLRSLEDLPTVQLEFHTDAVPWLLDEPEPA